MQVEPGTQIGRYEVHRRLGRGGMGTVYVAHDPVLGRMVAIKLLDGDIYLPDARDRFRREARSAAALNHPNIVTIHDFGEFGSQPYIVMEYVAGETLAHVIRGRAEVPLVQKLRWIEDLCDGVGYAHKQSVIHRDLKPANLMIDRSQRLKILDFGIARMMGGAPSTTSTMMGTPGYMAPEQLEGGSVDERADLFSIGVVFYELLAFTEAFPGETPAAITYRVLSQDPVPLRQLVPDLAPDILAICERALKKSPAERFAFADDMRAAIYRTRNELDLEADQTILIEARREPPPVAAEKPPTGPEQQRGGVDGVTPPAGSRRHDREALARRRSEWLNAALQEARTALTLGNLEMACEACERALTFDETNPGALELEQKIQEALEASTPPTPDTPREFLALPGVAAPTELRAQARTFEPIVAPGRRTPPPPPTTSQVSLPDPDATQMAPRSKKPPVESKPRRGIDNVLGRARGVVAAAFSFADTHRKAAIAAAGILALAILLAAVVLTPRAPAPTGTLVIDAVPWAVVIAVESSDGKQVQLPEQAATPLRLELPSDTYKITLTGPPPESRTEQLEAQVGTGATHLAPRPEFRTITVEEYFEQYLGSPTATIADANTSAATTGGSVVPALNASSAETGASQ